MLRIAHLKPPNILGRFNQIHAVRCLAHGALDLGMALMSDHDNFAPLRTQLGNLDVHLGHQRTGGIEHTQAARLGVLAHRLRNTMRAENHRITRRHLVEFFDKDRALGTQVIDHEFVMHHLVTHVNRRTVQRQGAFNDLDGAINAGTKAAGFGEENLHGATL